MTDASVRIRLHDLDSRRDGDEWIVGRMSTGCFVALPDIGKRALDLLGQGLSAAEVSARLKSRTGEDIDVPDFVEGLLGLGFVAEVDGRAVPSPPPPRPSLPRIRPRHVRWALSPVLPVLVGVLVAAAVTAQLTGPGVTLNHRTLLWSPHGSLVILVAATVGWTLLLLHECAHLITARATGVPGRIRLGTRLQFLVMQTDISGIELASRRHRLTAYLAGIATNLSVASLAILLATTTQPSTTEHRLLAALTLLALAPLPFQCMVFMRTDLYFVLQDLTRCRDLYGDGAAYARYTARRWWHRAVGRGGGPPEEDPSRGLPAHERRAVRAYSVVLVVGTALCLAFLVTVTLPADIILLARAVAVLGPGHTVLENLDAAAVLLVLGGLHLLWARTWWRGRRARARARAGGVSS
jgi:hypothetical protein